MTYQTPAPNRLSDGAKVAVIISSVIAGFLLLVVGGLVAFSVFIQAKTDAEEADPNHRTRQDNIAIYDAELERRGVPVDRSLLSIGLNTCDLIIHNGASMESLVHNIGKSVDEQYVNDVLYASVLGFCPEYLPAVEEYLG